MAVHRKPFRAGMFAGALVLVPMPPVAAISADPGTPWQVIEMNMKESLDAYRKGDQEQAYLLSATAYLDGFELLEDRLKEVDYDLMKMIEQGMEQLRNLMRQGAPLGVIESQNGFVQNLLAQARDALDAEGDNGR